MMRSYMVSLGIYVQYSLKYFKNQAQKKMFCNLGGEQHSAWTTIPTTSVILE